MYLAIPVKNTYLFLSVSPQVVEGSQNRTYFSPSCPDSHSSVPPIAFMSSLIVFGIFFYLLPLLLWFGFLIPFFSPPLSFYYLLCFWKSLSNPFFQNPSIFIPILINTMSEYNFWSLNTIECCFSIYISSYLSIYLSLLPYHLCHPLDSLQTDV